MAATEGLNVAELVGQHLESASPDVLRAMVKTFADALMSAEADALCGAGYGERSTERTTRVTATGRGSGTPGPAPSSSLSRSCARAPTSRTQSTFTQVRSYIS